MRMVKSAALLALLLALAGCKTESSGDTPTMRLAGDTDPMTTGAIKHDPNDASVRATYEKRLEIDIRL